MAAPKIHEPKDIFPKVFDAVAKGLSLLKALESLDPAPSLTWAKQAIRNDPELRIAFDQAMEDRADYLADDLIQLSDEEIPDGLDGAAMSAWAARQKLRVHARMWSASKLRPAVYGNRVDLAVSHGISITRVLELANRRIATIDME